jgi:hypothetical protein
MNFQRELTSAQEQANREQIAALLSIHGTPDKGRFHVVREGRGVECKNTRQPWVDFDAEQVPTSTAVMYIRHSGDQHFYDAQGYEVFAD